MALTNASDAVLVKRVTLIAPATIAADCILASAVLTHSRKLDALVDVLTLGEAVSPRAQLRVGLRSRFRTQLAPVATPGATHGTTAETLREMAFDRTDALAVAIIQEARFLPGVDARGVCDKKKHTNCA